MLSIVLLYFISNGKFALDVLMYGDRIKVILIIINRDIENYSSFRSRTYCYLIMYSSK